MFAPRLTLGDAADGGDRAGIVIDGILGGRLLGGGFERAASADLDVRGDRIQLIGHGSTIDQRVCCDSELPNMAKKSSTPCPVLDCECRNPG